MRDDRPAILIAEDNRAMAHVLRFNLERAGFFVGVAFDGVEALQHLEERPFDLVLTDFQMPRMDGAELCRQIRDVLRLEELPIVLCSAKGLEADAANLVVTCGISRVLYKPVSPQEIVAIARELLDAQICVPCSPSTLDL